MSEIILRSSSLSAFSDCQLRAAGIALAPIFRDHGHRLLPRRTHVGALIGSGVHAAGEVALKEKLLSGTVTPIDALEDAGIEGYRARWAQDAGDFPVVMDEESPTREHGERQIRRMVGAYRRDVAERAEPLAVESRLECEVEPGLILSGQADLLALDGASGKPTMRDLKTGRRRSTSPWKHAPQIGSYSLLVRSRGFLPEAAQIDLLQRVRDSAPQPGVEAQPLDIAATEQIATAVLHDFGAKARAFLVDGDPSRFLPNPGSFLCSPKFCPLHGSDACPATRRRSR